MLAIASLLSACKSVEPTHGLPPFFEVYETPSSTTARGSQGEEAPGSEWYLRPLFSVESWSDDTTRVKALFPFWLSHNSPAKEVHQLTGIFRYSSLQVATGGEDVDWMLFPFFYGGSDPEEGGYFAFFPFGGQLKGLLAADSIWFWLFPFYLKLHDGERQSTHWLWPLINTVEGAGWSGWRFLPFYADYAWDTEDGQPRSRRKAIMWPFWIRNTEWMQENPTEVFFSFPFYGYRESVRSKTETFVWPFFVSYEDKKRPERDHVGGFLFPYRFGEGHFDIWPFWGTKHVRDQKSVTGPVYERYRQFCLWPIQQYDWARDEREERTRFWVLPFFWRFEYKALTAAETDRERWKLWPFIGYREEGEEVGVDVLSPWPTNRLDYERTYGRLFAIFRYRSRPQYSGWELFWGTLYWGSGVRAAEEPEEHLFSVLGGLFEVGEREGSSVLRLLWIPWW